MSNDTTDVLHTLRQQHPGMPLAQAQELAGDADLRALVQPAYDACMQGRWDDAIPLLKQLEARRYNLADTYQALGTCAMGQGRMDDAIAYYKQALHENPFLVSAQDNLVMQSDAHPATTEAHAQALRRDWWEAHGAAAYAARRPHTNDPDPNRRLFVGYVGGDFRFHSAAISFSSIITRHSALFQPVVYCTLPPQFYDYVTTHFRDVLGPAFVDASRWTPDTLARVIREDRIDILVDLSGYTALNRLQTFAAMPAPVQVSGWGYALGNGWPAMTGVLADPFVAPDHLRAHMTDRVIDLPSILTITPREDLPKTPGLPMKRRGYPTFGVFQRSMKLTQDSLAVWVQLLQRLPEARMVFKCAGMSPTWREWVFQGMDPVVHQIEVVPPTEQKEHLLWYHEIDVALDSWPQTGGCSSLESLHMGVPIVTLLGDRMIQRTTGSFLANLKLDDFIATSVDEYLDIAVAMVTTKKERLAAIRATLRERLMNSPIVKDYVPAVEAAYRSLWAEWCACATQPADPLQ